MMDTEPRNGDFVEWQHGSGYIVAENGPYFLVRSEKKDVMVYKDQCVLMARQERLEL